MVNLLIPIVATVLVCGTIWTTLRRPRPETLERLGKIASRAKLTLALKRLGVGLRVVSFVLAAFGAYFLVAEYPGTQTSEMWDLAGNVYSIFAIAASFQLMGLDLAKISRDLV